MTVMFSRATFQNSSAMASGTPRAATCALTCA